MVVGGYRMSKLLGAGAMGRVYLAEHERLGRRAAEIELEFLSLLERSSRS